MEVFFVIYFFELSNVFFFFKKSRYSVPPKAMLLSSIVSNDF
ncbi:hypothetical protein CAPGI0001_1501 [Capnocytophaga gingivalis ATCC 33624]|nr:hypothetical protein CAPGI0001_1501 [Capnocytophaga gingivalis ATCC 33624]